MSKPKKPRKGARRALAPTKDETVEMKTGPSKQFKLPEPSRIEHHLANTEAYEKKLKDLKETVAKQYEVAAADGVSKDLLKDLMKLKKGDPIVARQALEAFGVGLKAIGAPFQLNVFDSMFENDVAQARAEGALAGRTGKPPECRWAEGSDAHEAFLNEYQFEQAKLAPGAQNLTEDQIRASISKKPQAQADLH